MEIWKKDSACCVRIINHRGREVRPYPQKAKRGDSAVYNSEYKNTPTTFEFTKIDITSGAELTGATLTVLDKDGNVVDTWTFLKKVALSASLRYRA